MREGYSHTTASIRQHHKHWKNSCQRQEARNFGYSCTEDHEHHDVDADVHKKLSSIVWRYAWGRWSIDDIAERVHVPGRKGSYGSTSKFQTGKTPERSNTMAEMPTVEATQNPSSSSSRRRLVSLVLVVLVVLAVPAVVVVVAVLCW